METGQGALGRRRGTWARQKGVTFFFFLPPSFKTGNTAFKPIREMEGVNQQQSVGFKCGSVIVYKDAHHCIQMNGFQHNFSIFQTEKASPSRQPLVTFHVSVLSSFLTVPFNGIHTGLLFFLLRAAGLTPMCQVCLCSLACG